VHFRRGGLLARQLQSAERALALLAISAPAGSHDADFDPDMLRQALRNLDAVAQLLGQDPTRLRA